MYTESKVVMSDDVEFSIHDLAAGTALSEVDTDALAHPYAPAEAKPIHFLSKYHSNRQWFYSEIIGDAKVTTPTVWCLSGRDGVNTSDWNVTMVDDAECSSTMMLAQNAEVC